MPNKFTSFVEYVANNFNNSYTYPAHVIKKTAGTLFCIAPAGLMFAVLHTEGKHGFLIDALSFILCVLALLITVLCGFGYAVFTLCVVLLDVVIGKFICYRTQYMFTEEED